MNLISTRDLNKEEITYNDALLEGLAPDGGLYVPVEYPQISSENLKKMRDMDYPQLSFLIKSKLIGNSIPFDILKKLVKNAYSQEKFSSKNFNTVPIRKIKDNLFIENLSLGPTAAFKDMALQLLGQEMNYELKKRGSKLIILGATSGDTGSSAEAAMKGLERIKLFMLSPECGMSDFQKAQMGNLTKDNIFNISIKGRFDDCQDLVKAIKSDPEFNHLGAVNSINWGRISSQIPYYFSGYIQATSSNDEVVDFCVPSGNFGNVLACYIAKKMGCPIRRIIIATNENNVLDKLVKTGIYEKTPSKITSSPSMDISKASNYERLLFDMVQRDPQVLKKLMLKFDHSGKIDLNEFDIKQKFKEIGFYSGSSTHQNRLDTIKEVYDLSGTVIETHTADGVYVAKSYIKDDVPMICMETALPVKFEQTIKEALGFIPAREKRFEDIENSVDKDAFYIIDNDINKVKNYIRENI